jgi:hypothetical protein
MSHGVATIMGLLSEELRLASSREDHAQAAAKRVRVVLVEVLVDVREHALKSAHTPHVAQKRGPLPQRGSRASAAAALEHEGGACTQWNPSCCNGCDTNMCVDASPEAGRKHNAQGGERRMARLGLMSFLIRCMAQHLFSRTVMMCDMSVAMRRATCDARRVARSWAQTQCARGGEENGPIGSYVFLMRCMVQHLFSRTVLMCDMSVAMRPAMRDATPEAGRKPNAQGGERRMARLGPMRRIARHFELTF